MKPGDDIRDYMPIEAERDIITEMAAMHGEDVEPPMSDRPATPLRISNPVAERCVVFDANGMVVGSLDPEFGAAYIVHAANSLPKLEAEIERLRCVLLEVQTFLMLGNQIDAVIARIDDALNPEGGTDDA